MSGRSKTNREVEAPEEPEHDGSKLPEGWCDVRLVDLLKPNGLFDGPFGSNLKTSDYSETGVRVIRLENLGNLKFYDDKRTFIRRDKYESLLKHTVVPGDIIFGSFVDQRVRVCILPHLEVPAIAKADCFCIRPIMELVDSRFLTFALGRDRTRDELVEQIHGATRPRINTTQLREHRLPLAPLAEQRRIVAKLEQLLAKVSSSQQRLSRIPALLKRFRQSVLAAACSGRLTADWREENDEPETKPRDEDIVATEHVPTIPSTWTYRRANEIVAKGTVISYGMVLPGPNQSEGIPYVRGQDIDDFGNIHVTQLWRTKPEIAAKHRRSELLEGDVLLCVIRHLRVAIVPRGLDGANLTQGTVRLRPSNDILGPYLANCLASPQSQEWMKSRYIGMAMPRINVEHAREIPIPLPPKAEQHEIVRRVEKLFTFADQIEARLKHAQAHVDRLTQSLLAKAFRGELVPTEHALAEREGREYESAEQLLARIRAAKTEERPGANKKGRRQAGAQA